MNRVISLSRATRETRVECRLDLDGTGQVEVRTGIGFLDHLWTAMAVHGRFDLDLRCQGDLQVDDHHSAEDTALALGQALDQALGDRRGIARFGEAIVPMDEALARVVVDLSGRPMPVVDLGLRRPAIGDLATEMIPHVLQSLAVAGRMALHADVIRGDNDHHRAEATFKALGLALRRAVALDGPGDRIPSSKGAL
ncbi:MAG TPA: imidazoleglycerol-phosphate dehydratase HisB [Myxococcota bacterium]|nr:imidazoleglycerol-phosphate dehydratase HisB [Myxococcota bacterium]HQK52500.1 imidazoleglycerol-phosphate dehydratase HisB [Myxococcota bacterium]